MPYEMPLNLETCSDSFAMEQHSAEYLMNPPPSLPKITVAGGNYGYIQYKEDLVYAKEMDKTMERMDDMMMQLCESGFLGVVGDKPSLMFDVDNAM